MLDTTKSVTPSKDSKTAKYWNEAISDAKTLEKDYRNTAESLIKLYEGGAKKKSGSYNILYANTTVLAPAVYSAVPRPSVKPRQKKPTPISLAVSATLEQTISFLLDQGCTTELTFNELVSKVILSGLVVGRGVGRFIYDASIYELPSSTLPAQRGQQGEDLQDSDSTEEVLNGETIKMKFVPHDKFLHNHAETWDQVNFVAFQHNLTRAEVVENFGEKIASAVPYSRKGSSDYENTEDKRDLAVIQEIWDKTTRKVYYICEGYNDAPLRIVDDPLELEGFFPMPKPMYFVPQLSGLLPIPLYTTYRKQADELELISQRITNLIEALKVRGAYNAMCSELGEILKQDDNGLVAIDSFSALAEGVGFDQILKFLPLGELIQVVQQLYIQRTQIKQIIQEITGLSDIIRGSSVASETATAQNLKNQWGTLKLKDLQNVVNFWCRDSMRIMAEMAAKNFNLETFKRMTDLPFVGEVEKNQAMSLISQIQQQQIPGQEPQIPPELMQAANSISWEEVQKVMADNLLSSHLIDIETNSTQAADLAEDRENRVEMMNALAQFLNGLAPLLSSGQLSFDVAKALLVSIVKKMPLGGEVIETIEKMQAPPSPQSETSDKSPGHSQEIVAAQQQLEQSKLQIAQQKLQMELEAAQLEHQMKIELLQSQQNLAMLKVQGQIAAAQSRTKLKG